jgi:thiamine biosynthesis lipoprotein
MHRRTFLMMAASVLAGCDDKPNADAPPPRPIALDAVGQFCGMTLAEHPGPKGQIFVRGRTEPYWFATVRETIAFTLLPEMPKGTLAIYVSDMARSKDLDQPEVWGAGKPGVVRDRQPATQRHGYAGGGTVQRSRRRPALRRRQRRARCPPRRHAAILHSGRRGVMNAATRRRFITISAAAAGFSLLSPRARLAETSSVHVWRGAALGADAMLLLHHPEPTTAEALIHAALAEVARLERQLSLYDPDSALVRLNREGALDHPPLDLLRAMNESARFHALTGGAFDVTVQPLWELYAAHFERPGSDPAGPPAAALEKTLARVGQHRVSLAAERIGMAPGTAVTLNGIGQGYITDRVVALLRANGIAHALVDMGETRAIGGHPDGGPWRVGLDDPFAPGNVAEQIPLADRAVSTSGGYGTRFDAAGRFNHIFDPGDGSASHNFAAVSVIAPDATMADALSTAFSIMAPPRITEIVRALGIAAHLALPDGSRSVIV